MLNLIFAGLANEIVRDVISGHEKETSRNPFLQPIEDEIERLEKVEEQLKERLESLRKFHCWVSELFEPPKTEKSETTEGKPVETRTPEAAAPEKPATSEAAGEESSTATATSRLQVLESGVKAAVKALKVAPMTGRFQQIGKVCELLSAALKETPGLTEMERIARLETAIGEAVAFFRTSKLAKRFGVLKEVKRVLEDAMDKRAQI